jgi:serine/threonine-protein kinase
MAPNTSRSKGPISRDGDAGEIPSFRTRARASAYGLLMSTTPDMQLPPEFLALQAALVGRYSLVRELGRGGMGIVFLARDVALDRPVAIKLLPPEFAISAHHRERFLREARTAARLSHPHIVPIHAVEERGELVYFVMSYVDGETLAMRVQRDGPLDHREAMRVTREVAWALGHAHANGIVHRDVKPDNVLIERESGRALVTDFGIAQALDAPDSSGSGRVAGTPRYMSPEQASGEKVDGRSDIYSLGAMAYFMVTGRSPFEGASAAALLVKHISEPVPVVRAANPRLPLDFATAIERCLAKDPADRPQRAEDLARVLEPSTERIAAPVAAFLRDMEVAGGEIGMALSGFLSAVVMVALATRETTNPSFGQALSLTVALVMFYGAAATMGGLVIVRMMHVIERVRALLRSGYAHTAVTSAIPMVQGSAAPVRHSALGNSLRVIGTLGALALARAGSGWLPLVGAAGAVAIPTVALRQLWIEKRIWARGLAGRFGRLLFRVASIGLDTGGVKPALGEPTAVAIGSAAAEAFEAMSDAQQARYRELPAVINRLEAEALSTRAAGDDRRFTAAVSALESLRLDLLRMHAGAAPIGDLTASIDAAGRIGRDIDRRLAAAGELDQVLRDSAG